ncbi:protease modulator HflC [Phenylobacterium sp.]|uniref:protease modulator HflC n=1 Tax=Phenylobacterium sp. TaxID=1871053 RepID=UPI0025D1CF0B|nr:protease modulator HflC [Phenylobacterium sp.]
MNPRSLILAVIAAVVLMTLWQTFFIVDQREQVIVVALGKPVGVINPPGKSEAGLHMKIPFTQQLVRLDRRNVPLLIEQEEIIGAKQERLVVDAFIRYQIVRPLEFYTTLRDEEQGKDRIERLVSSSLRQVLGTATQDEIVSGRRAQLMQQARADVQLGATASRMGIRVIDLRIRRTDLPAQNRDSVYKRMASSRKQEATRLRALGEQQKREIMAGADKEVAITLATAREQSGQITGEGDAQRTRIFAQSFGKDPSFAAFFRSMQAYQASFSDGQTTLVLSPDSAFFRYFEHGPTGKK